MALNVILKYVIDLPVKFIPFTSTSKVLHVDMQCDKICVWVQHDESINNFHGLSTARIHLQSTGDVFHLFGEYIGTVVDEKNCLVWHLFLERCNNGM